MLELQHIHKMYNPGTINEICLFEDFNLKIEDGQFVSVVGSNGSGKTSMLNIICGSIPVDAGKILVNGVDISRQKDYIRHRRIGRVFQDPSKGTCPSMTILENLAIADNKGKAYGLGRGTNHARMDAYRELLASVGVGTGRQDAYKGRGTFRWTAADTGTSYGDHEADRIFDSGRTYGCS